MQWMIQKLHLNNDSKLGIVYTEFQPQRSQRYDDLIWGPPPLFWKGPGTSHRDTPLEKTWDQWKYYGKEMGYPPAVNRQTSVKIVPSPSFGCRRQQMGFQPIPERPHSMRSLSQALMLTLNVNGPLVPIYTEPLRLCACSTQGYGLTPQRTFYKASLPTFPTSKTKLVPFTQL